MSTAHRAESIACAAESFHPLLGPTSARDLLAWVAAELGDASALDRWFTHGGARTKALAPSVILHVVSGNTPHAALQSLIGGLLLGSRNLVKLPGSGLDAFDDSEFEITETSDRPMVATAGYGIGTAIAASR